MRPARNPPPAGITERQRACLDAIELHLAKTRTMPSLEELRAALGFTSNSGVLRLLQQLEERGRITRLPRRARSIALLDAGTCRRCGARLRPEDEAS